MSAPNVVEPGSGELIGDAPDRRVEILSDVDAVHATWSRFAPGREGAELHVHRRHTDLFYVLEGELTVRLGRDGQRIPVAAGMLVRVPPLVVHGFGNAGDAEVRFLNLHAPGQGFAGYLRALRDGRTPSYDQQAPPADGGRSASEVAVGGDGDWTDRPGLRARVLADVEEIAIAEAHSDPGDPAPSPHVHRRHVESFYVLEGELALTMGDREIRARAGSWVQVPPGVWHVLSAGGPQPARFLDLHTPSWRFGALDQQPAP